MTEQRRLEGKLDADLAAWLTGEGDDTREMIIEARLPPKTVRMSRGAYGGLLPEETASSGQRERASVLGQVQDYVSGLVGSTTNLLSAAGAVAVRANRAQLSQIVKHPLVKAVRVNRRLRPGRAV